MTESAQQALAAQVVLTVKAAMGPLLERVAASDARVAELQRQVTELSGFRDRLVAMETKAAMPVTMPPVVDVEPILQRVSAAEGRLSAVETKAAAVPPTMGEPIDLTPVVARIAAAEARLDTLGDVRDRVVATEGRMTSVESKVPGTSDVKALTVSTHSLMNETSLLRERVGVLEVRAQIPGPPGKDGQNGLDGKDGKDGRDGKDGTNGTPGADGLGWDDLAVVQDDERSFTIRCARGLQVKDVGHLTFPVEIYRGVYIEGKAYERGDRVTWAGSEWHCNEPTTIKPGESVKAWTLSVKRGRDGKDGRDAPSLPVVSVGR